MASSVVLNVDLGKNPSITSEAGFYCLQYMISKSAQFDLHCSIRTSKHRTIAREYQEIAWKIQEAARMLECFYPHLFSYSSTAGQFSCQEFTSQTVVCNVFKLFTKELFKKDISWSRVIVLFAFAGMLSVHCIQGNKPEFLKTIIYCVKKFVDDNLVEWIKDHGGWRQIIEEFSNFKTKPKWWPWEFTDGIKGLAKEKCECFWNTAMALWSTK